MGKICSCLNYSDAEDTYHSYSHSSGQTLVMWVPLIVMDVGTYSLALQTVDNGKHIAVYIYCVSFLIVYF